MGQATASFRFYAELNDFLPPEQRQRPFAHHFDGRVSVKHLIESLGVPHIEIDLILVNGMSVDFSYLVQDGDEVSVYPVFESLDIRDATHLRPEPLRQTRFVLDNHLGQLATYLRMIGFDTLYENDYQDEVLARMAGDDGRILLTRDRGLLKRNAVIHGYWIRTNEPQEQLAEVIERFDLTGSIKPFQRCLRCNGELRPVPKEDVADRLQPNTRRYYDEFRMCQACQQVYWKGSHYQCMRRFLQRLDILLEPDENNPEEV